MASSLNKVTLIGNLGQDPEKRFSNAGNAFTTFSIATTARWRDRQTQESREETEWHSVICFGRLAEIASEYLKKGGQVYVEGELRTRSWERDGIRQQRTEVRARELILLGGPNAPTSGTNYSRSPQSEHQRVAPDNQQSRQAKSKPSHQPESPPDLSYDDIDDDIPF